MSNKHLTELIGEKYANELLAILNKYIPKGVKVYAYGSRVREENRHHSDLDLALETGGQDFSLKKIAKLKLELEESDLPFKVDVLKTEEMDEDFLAMIRPDFVKIDC